MPLAIERIQAARPANQIHYFASLGSTMTEAARLAAAGAAQGTAVIADEQTSGVGRLGRKWESPAGEGVYCTVLLRLQLMAASAPIASLLVGLAAADAVHKTTNLLCDLRWPNDVLIRERKVAGILTQWVDGCILAGIGINVNQLAFPPDLRTPATSLRMECNGRAQEREGLIAQLLGSIESYCDELTSGGVRGTIAAFMAASSYASNRRVVVEESGLQGVTAGLDENGFLLIRYTDGKVQRLATGGVRPA